MTLRLGDTGMPWNQTARSDQVTPQSIPNATWTALAFDSSVALVGAP